MGLVPLVAHPIPPPMLYMCIRFWYVCTYTHACHNSVRTYVHTYVCVYTYHVNISIISTIISFRGLLMPKIVVDDFGGTRTDPGMLGSGIYFASSSRLTKMITIYDTYDQLLLPLVSHHCIPGQERLVVLV